MEEIIIEGVVFFQAISDSNTRGRRKVPISRILIWVIYRFEQISLNNTIIYYNMQDEMLVLGKTKENANISRYFKSRILRKEGKPTNHGA